MKAFLMLFACLAFSWWVLRKQLASEEGFSAALWLPTIWIFRCASRSIDYWLEGRGMELATLNGTVRDTEHADAIFLGVLVLMAYTVLARRRLPWAQIIRANVWLFVLFGYIGVSCLWAGDIGTSLKRYFRTSGDLAMALIVLTEARPMAAFMAAVCRAAVLYVPLSVVLCKYFPNLGRLQSKSWNSPDMWLGVSSHKNTLAAFLMLAVFCYLWRLWKARQGEVQLVKLGRPRWLCMEVIYLGMAGCLILYSRCRSSTAIIAIGMACLVFFLFEKSGPYARAFFFRLLVLALLAGAVQIFSYVFTGGSFAELLLAIQGKSVDLTGRTEYWPVLIHLGFDSPIFGAGYGGFWTSQMQEYFLAISKWGFLPDAHNGYIETFLELGLVGLSLLLMVLVSAIRCSFRELSTNFERARVRLGFLSAILLHNYAEASFPIDNKILWVAFLAVALNPGAQPSDPSGSEAPLMVTVEESSEMMIRSDS